MSADDKSAKSPAAGVADGAMPSLARDEVFEGLWSAVLDRWDELPRHQAALARAVETEALAELAKRYRETAKEEPKKERAEERLQAIIAAATQVMLAKKTPRADAPTQRGLTYAVVLAVAVLLFALLRSALRR